MAELVQSVQRAMALLNAFSEATPRMRLAEIAEACGLARGTAHRLLSTLEQLGYVRRTDGTYELTPRVLDIGYAYLSSQPLATIGRPVIERLSEEVDEHASVGVLVDAEVLIVVSTPARHQIAVHTRVGDRLPLVNSASGRSLVSAFDDDAARVLCDRSGATAAEVDRCVAEAQVARTRGYTLTDESLASGLVSVAAPVSDRSGNIVAALAVATPKSRHGIPALEREIAPAVMRAAADLGNALGY